MKPTILSLTLLGLFLASALANNIISEQNQGNIGGRSHQSVSIDHEKKVVNVDNNNGWNSWNSVWDYKTGYVATRILSKKACVVARMNPEVMPDVTVLPKAIKEKQKSGLQGPADKEISYMVSSKRISDLTPFGKNVEALCRGIPTYAAHEVKRQGFFYYSGSCFRANILCLLGISYCGETFQS